MKAGDAVLMQHPDGYTTITGSGGQFVAWIPNGIPGSIYLLTPDQRSAVVNFDGKLIATVPIAHLRAVAVQVVPAA
jgi:hypothetical protein